MQSAGRDADLAEAPLPFFSQLYRETFATKSAANELSSQQRPSSTIDANSAPASVSSENRRHSARELELLLNGPTRRTSPFRYNPSVETTSGESLKQPDGFRSIYEPANSSLTNLASQKENQVENLQQELALLRRQADYQNRSQGPSTSNRATRGGSGNSWDISGLFEQLRRPNNTVENVKEELEHKERENKRLSEALSARNASLIQLQDQLDSMERYFNDERQAFQKECEVKSRRVEEIMNSWEREKEITISLMQQLTAANRQVDQKESELQRRENWIKDLTNKCSILDQTVTLLRQTLESKESELQRVTAHRALLQSKLDVFESGLKIFKGYELGKHNTWRPVTLILRLANPTGAYWLTLRNWEKQETISFTNLISAEAIRRNIRATQTIEQLPLVSSPAKWFENVGGRKSALGANVDDITHYADEASHSKQFRLLLALTTVGTRNELIFAFDSQAELDEVQQAFQLFIARSRDNERQLREKQRSHCLCEVEAMLFGLPISLPITPLISQAEFEASVP